MIVLADKGDTLEKACILFFLDRNPQHKIIIKVLLKLHLFCCSLKIVLKCSFVYRLHPAEGFLNFCRSYFLVKTIGKLCTKEAKESASFSRVNFLSYVATAVF